ncbi:MAG: DUF202 domain-containing protein [Pseudomonadota bacterium]
MSDKNDLAEDRTDWAEDRTVLAVERTFSSWVGLGLGGVGVALAMRAVFSTAEPTWVPKTFASAFLLIAIAIYWVARRQACRTYDRLSTHDTKSQTPRTFTWLASSLTVATLGVGGVLWSL